MLLRPAYNIFGVDTDISEIKKDCEKAFNCRSFNSSKENYSTGATYFIRANESPACNLENLALQIFKHHTKDITYNPAQSGAEWWSQAIDSRDDIGFHWDRDYGLEEEKGEHIYPNFGTVTYLTNQGGPTLVLDQEGTADNEELVIGSSQQFSCSMPAVGKSIAFDGNLLHAAPSDLTEDDEESEDEEGEDSASEGEDSDGVKRITFLVNIWIDHVPMHSHRYKLKHAKELQPVNDKLKLQFDNPAPTNATTISLSPKDCNRFKKWEFVHSDVNYAIKMPLPNKEATTAALQASDIVHYNYVTSTDKTNKPAVGYSGHGIEILISENQPSDAEFSTGEEDSQEGSADEEESSEEEEVKEKPAAKKRRF